MITWIDEQSEEFKAQVAQMVEKYRLQENARIRRRYHSDDEYRHNKSKRRDNYRKYEYILRMLEDITDEKWEMHHPFGISNSDAFVFMRRTDHRKLHKSRKNYAGVEEMQNGLCV